jgi:hypothetical protein
VDKDEFFRDRTTSRSTDESPTSPILWEPPGAGGSLPDQTNAQISEPVKIPSVFCSNNPAQLLLTGQEILMPKMFFKVPPRFSARVLAATAWLLFASGLRAAPLENPSTNFSSVLVGFAGKVEVTAVNTNDWQAARTNQVLLPGDRLRTAADSRATLQLSDRSVIRVGADTILEIQPPTPPAQHRFGLKRGALFFLDREQPADIEFETPLTTGAIRGTEFLLTVADADAATHLALLDGAVELKTSGGPLSLTNGQEIILSPSSPAKISAVLPVANLIQWSFYYPGVMNPDEIPFSENEKSALATSLAAYRDGDLLHALAAASAELATQSEATRIYFAQLKLAVGQVSDAENLIANIGDSAAPLRELIAAVRGGAERRPPARLVDEVATSRAGGRRSASELLAHSYALQSAADLPNVLAAARQSAKLAPNFGFAWARVAELEFGFEHRRAALDALAHAKKLSPRHAPAVALEGFIALSENHPRAALGHFDAALALDDSLPTEWLGRALAEAALGDDRETHRNLQIAAALEPQRGLYRSYLGKSWSQNGNDKLAEKEFSLAQKLDPADPTAWLYSALHKFQTHQVNDAVRDLERSMELNDNRSIFRSRLQLDRDRATRSADLAAIYNAAGLEEVGQSAAHRAVGESYSDFSGHLFLADSLANQEDPQHFNLRLESARESERLVANLLAPPGGGNLSSLLSQQDHLQNFDTRPFGFSSLTEYNSRGDWSESATAFGHLKNFSYALDVQDISQNGQRKNNSLNNLEFAFHAKVQVTPADSLYFSVDTLERGVGDVAQHFSPANSILGLHANENQSPNLFVGWNHEWSPGSHTLFLFSRLTDDLFLTNPVPSVLFLQRNFGGIVGVNADPYFTLKQQQNFTLYSAEAQQIWESAHHAFIIGGRFQHGDVNSRSLLTRLFGATTAQNISPSLERFNGYGYYQWRPVNAFRLTAGLSYDQLMYPRNVDLPPMLASDETRSLLGPKIGFTGEPWRGGWLHAAWTRSLGGLFFDNSIRLEPADVAGAVSSFRSLIPESVAGLVPGTRFDSWTIGFDQKLPSETYFGFNAELLMSDGSRDVGAFSNSIPFIPVPDSLTSARQNLDYRERNVSAYFAQLLGKEFSVGARYRLSEAKMETSLPGLRGISGVSSLNQNQRAVLQHGQFFLIYNHPRGFFAEWSSDWFHQANHAGLAALPDADFWQHNFFLGYVFPHRRAELRLGLLNLTDENYRLSPLNAQSELARGRTFTASLRLNY